MNFSPISGTDIAKSFLRHDPDVIIVGEIRDADVAEIAIQAADTGHLVLSTLHTKDAVSTVNRMINLGVNRSALADNLSIVVSQRLLRKVCPACAKLSRLSLKSDYAKFFNLKEEVEHLEAVGCPECNHTGYKGRLSIFESLVTGPAFRRAVESASSADDIAASLDTEQHHTLLEDGLRCVLDKQTTFEELDSLIINERIKRGLLC